MLLPTRDAPPPAVDCGRRRALGARARPAAELAPLERRRPGPADRVVLGHAHRRRHRQITRHRVRVSSDGATQPGRDRASGRSRLARGSSHAVPAVPTHAEALSLPGGNGRGDDAHGERVARTEPRRGRARCTRGRVVAGSLLGRRRPGSVRLAQADGGAGAAGQRGAGRAGPRRLGPPPLAGVQLGQPSQRTADTRRAGCRRGRASADVPRSHCGRARRDRPCHVAARATAFAVDAQRLADAARAGGDRARQRVSPAASRGPLGDRRSDPALQLAVSLAGAAAGVQARLAERPALVAVCSSTWMASRA